MATPTPRSLGSGLVVGAVIGLAAGGAVGWLIGQRARARTTEEWKLVPVLVTGKELPAGHTLTEADLVESTFPQPLVTESCATPATRSTFVGRTLRWRVAPETVVRDTDLIVPDEACAARLEKVVRALDGGTPELGPLVEALQRRHRGAQ